MARFRSTRYIPAQKRVPAWKRPTADRSESIPPNEIIETFGEAKPDGLILAKWSRRWYKVYLEDLLPPRAERIEETAAD